MTIQASGGPPLIYRSTTLAEIQTAELPQNSIVFVTGTGGLYMRSGASLSPVSGAASTTGPIYTDAGDGGATKGLIFGSAGDVSLYRAGADQLRTDDEFNVNGVARITSAGLVGTQFHTNFANTGAYFEAPNTAGTLGWYLSNRTSVNTVILTIQGMTGQVGDLLQLRQDSTAKWWATSGGHVGQLGSLYLRSADGTINFGVGDDASLARTAAGELTTPGRLKVANVVIDTNLFYGAGSTEVFFGSSALGNVATLRGTEAKMMNASGNPFVKVDAVGLGFYNKTPVALQTGVAVSTAGIHAALVNLGLITA